MKNKLMIAALALVIVMVPLAGLVHAQTMGMNASMMSQTDLWMGSEGSGVIALQTFLVSNGFLTMPQSVAMGYFGPLTKRALAQYQMSASIPSTGYYGPLTRAKLSAMMSINMGTGMNGNMPSSSMMMTSSTMMQSSTNSQGVLVGGAYMVANLNIVENAMNADNVTTLVAAVKAAGLVATLEGPGPFTVFAPTDAAFAKIPSSTIASLLLPQNKAELVNILTYHVVAGRYTSASLYDGEKLTTVEGNTLTINKSANGQIMVNGVATVQIPDVISSNGVTFVIDTVLMPPSNQ